MLGLLVGLKVGYLGRGIFALIARVAYTLVHGFLVQFKVGFGRGLMTAEITRVFNSFVQGYIFSKDGTYFFWPPSSLPCPKLENLGLKLI